MTSLAPWIASFYSRGHAPGDLTWLAEERERALQRFNEEGWPTPKLENWRHTSLASLQSQTFVAAPQNPDQRKADQARALVEHLQIDPNSHCLVFLDGRFVWHRPGSEAPALQIGPLAWAYEHFADELQGYYGTAAEGEATAALNLALANDGFCIRVKEGGEVAHPVHVICANGTAGVAGFLRNIVVVEPRARLTLIEHYVSADTVQKAEAGQNANQHLGHDPATADSSAQGVSHANETGASTFTNTLTRLHVGEEARVTHARLQQEGHEAFHLSAFKAVQEKRSSLASHSLSFGARLARHDIETRFDGTHGEALLNGLYFIDGQRHVDHHTRIDHAQPHCISHEYYRGILDDMARGVFTGRIVVAPGADGTDAAQRSDSLLLSPRARSDARPELEIYADDVKCSHGATVGQIDDDALFYLRARGMDGAQARSVLTYAFASSVLQRIELPALRRLAAQSIRRLLPAGEQLLEEFE